MIFSYAEERDSSWEDWSPTFRLFIYPHESGEGENYVAGPGADVYDITEADLSEVIDYAEQTLLDGKIYSIALVVDGDREIADRGLVWLSGLDFFDSPRTPDQVRRRRAMLSRVRRSSSK